MTSAPEGWLPLHLRMEYRIRLTGIVRNFFATDRGYEARMADQSHFRTDMTVDQAFRLHAGARRVFAKFHLGGCSNCAISETETIAQVSEGYGIPLPMLMEELEALFDSSSLTVGDRVKLPDAIREKIPQLKDAPEFGTITGFESGAYTAEFGELRLQGLVEDFIKATARGTSHGVGSRRNR